MPPNECDEPPASTSGADNLDWPRDEYDNYLPAIAAHLHRRDLDGLTAHLAGTGTDEMGMSPG
jgi:hypothetical protein